MEIYFIRPYLHGPSAARFIQDALSNGFKHEGYNCQSHSSIDIPKLMKLRAFQIFYFVISYQVHLKVKIFYKKYMNIKMLVQKL